MYIGGGNRNELINHMCEVYGFVCRSEWNQIENKIEWKKDKYHVIFLIDFYKNL